MKELFGDEWYCKRHLWIVVLKRLS
jgi:hypothetical protein